MCRLIVAIALLLLLSGAVALQGKLSLTRQYRRPGPFTDRTEASYPTSTFNTGVLVAAYTITLPEEPYLAASEFCPPADVVPCPDEPAIAPCCSNCSMGALRSPPNCFCPVTPGAVCVDTSHAVELAAGNLSYEAMWEFGLLSGAKCRNWFLVPFPRYDACVIEFFDDDNESDVRLSPYYGCTNLTAGKVWKYAQVRPTFAELNNFEFAFWLTEDELMHAGLSFSLLPLTDSTLMCGTEEYSPEWTVPTLDPAISYWSQDIPTFQQPRIADVLRNVLSFYVLYDAEYTSFAPADFLSCQLMLRDISNAAGQSLDTVVTFTPLQPLECTADTIARLTDIFGNMRQIILFSSLKYFLNLLGFQSVINASAEYSACRELLTDYLQLAPRTAQTTLPLSTICHLIAGEAGYADDPCCNMTLAATQCCVPRPDPALLMPRYGVDMEAISSTCLHKRCAAEQMAFVAEEANLQPQCVTDLAAVLSDPKMTMSLMSLCPMADLYIMKDYSDDYLRPCASDVDCPSSSCLVDPFRTIGQPLEGVLPLTQGVCAYVHEVQPIYECLLRHTHPVVRASAAVANGVLPSVSDSSLARTVISGSKSNIKGSIKPCNWRPDLSEDECNVLFGSEYFCAAGTHQEDGTSSFEISRPEGCFALFQDQDLCESLNGTFVAIDEEDIRLGTFDCFLQDRSSAIDACLEPEWCPLSRQLADVYGRAYCDAYCTFPFVALPDECDCAFFNDTESCAALGVQWNFATQTCDVANYTAGLYDLCAYMNGSFWLGASWQPAFLMDKASCEGYGLCTSQPDEFWRVVGNFAAVESDLATASSCGQGCDIAGAPSRAACAATGFCEDAYLYNKCYLPATLTPELHGGCQSPSAFWKPQQIPPSICISDAYDAENGPELCVNAWYPEPLNPQTKETCPQRLSCLLANGTVRSPLPADQCSLCGGVVQPSMGWRQGAWHNGTFMPFKWLKRGDSMEFPYRDLLIGVTANELYGAYFYLYLSSVFSANILCKQQALVAALPPIFCDCVQKREDCYSRPALNPGGVAYACSQFSTTYAYKSSFTYSVVPTGGPLAVNASCELMAFSVATLDSFAVQAATPFASFFLAALPSDPYAIVRNNRSTAVGQLAGDVVRVEIVPVSTLSRMGYAVIDGGRLCINRSALVRSRSEFPIPTFASWTETHGRNVFVPEMEVELDGQAMCGNVSRGGVYAPVMLARNWESLTPYEVLPRSSQGAFLAAAICYSILVAVCLLRLYRLARGNAPADAYTFTCFSLLALFLFVRAVLFILLRSGALAVSTSPGFFFFAEFPTFLEFSITTVIVYLWARLYHARSRHLHLRWTLYLLNVALLVTFMSVIIAYAITPPPLATTRCARPPGMSKEELLDRTYKIIVGVVALSLSFCVLCYGILHLSRMSGAIEGEALWQLITVISLTWFGHFLQGILVFYIAFRPGNLAVVIAGAIAELTRPVAMLLIIRSVELSGLLKALGCGRAFQKKSVSDASCQAGSYVLMEDQDTDDF